jgi:tetratricopeptide (TPR) repeat protein
MSASVPNPTASPVEAEVRRIRELIERGQFAAALAGARAVELNVPENRDVLYMVAVSLRNLARIPEALATLERLQEFHPGFSRLYQERGHCYVALRDAPRAIEAFLVAVNLNPALPASWRTLQSLFRMTGQTAESATAAAHVATLANLPPEIVTATSMFSDGEFTLAEAVVRPFLLKHGDHVEGMRLLARIGLELDVLDDAEFLLEAVLAAAPNYSAARHDYAKVLLRRHKPVQALAELDKLLQGEPANRHYRTSYATALVGLGEHERALALHRELLAESPRAADLHLSVAHSLKTLGHQPAAIEAYRAAAAARPNYGDAYWSLANLKTYRFTPEEVARMRAEEAAAGTALVDRYHLCFALGKALEDEGDFGGAYLYYERGNALKRAETRYRPEPIERNARLQAAVCTREFFAARRGVGCDASDPIFIVGLPRSGSTLLEQILASHSAVEGTMELADVPRLVQGLQGRDLAGEDPRYPRVLAELPPAEFARLGRRYLDDTRVYRTDKPRFIDKMPNNFRHIGLIHLMLPNARIIDARREPMACCFSNFKQLFASGQEFTYSIEDIARYYRSYVELMAHWDDVLPGRILRIQHEDVVADLEGSVRRLLDFCGLEFEPACLDFHKTARSIRTASSEQVRRPIFREGLDQWRHFEPWLGPLRAALAIDTAADPPTRDASDRPGNFN